MVEELPVRNFRWVAQNDLNDSLRCCKNGEFDKIPPCTLSVNVKHNPKNFDKENVFAMCPNFYEERRVRKLAHALYDKPDYVIHYCTLKKYLEEGMIITKVNEAVLFTEEAWLKDYIDFCIEK